MRQYRLLLIIILIFSTILTAGCIDDPDMGKPTVGLAQCSIDESDWRIAMNKKYKANALQNGKFVLHITNGNGRVEDQISDIKDSLIPMGIKLLMVSPKEAEGLTEVVSSVYKSGIPVILIDRKTTDTNYTCFIGASNFQIGSKAADYAAAHGKDGATILEIHGEIGASPTIDRSNGFNTRINESYAYKNFQHVGDLHCEYSMSLAQSLMCDYLKDNPLPDIIWAHNDQMAIGASNAITEYGYDVSNVIIIGCDGTANGGIKAVMEGKIDATFLYQDGADKAVEVAEKILNGETDFEKNIILNTLEITKTNADGHYELMKGQEKNHDQIISLSYREKNLNIQTMGQLRTIILGSILCFIMFLLLVYVAKLHMTNKIANQMLNEKNAEVNAQKEELEAQAAHLAEVNKQLEGSKEQILGSIRYAQTIQTATLPTEHDLNCELTSFVLYRPKDIVSGDFYWNHCEKLDDREIHIIGVIDCTGHGVPGAFMSLIGVNLMDQIVKQNKTFSPAKILSELNTAVRTALRQEESHNNDGMEAIICKIEDFGNNKYSMTYEGAKFPIFHYSKSGNKIEILKSSRRQIGGQFRHMEQMLNFEDHTIEVEPGDRIYMSSDGIGDQNNQARKRYTTSRLVEKLLESINMTMPQQRDYIWKDVSTFMLGCNQRDDITVLGVEI